jgi:hypothetical protein
MFENVIDINLCSAFYTSRQVLPHMLQNKWGRIINVASVHGLVASKNKVLTCIVCLLRFLINKFFPMSLCVLYKKKKKTNMKIQVCVCGSETWHGRIDQSDSVGERRSWCDGQCRVPRLGAHRADREANRAARQPRGRVDRRRRSLAASREAAVALVCHSRPASRYDHLSRLRRRFPNHWCFISTF